MLAEVTLEGVTFPASFCLDDVEGDAAQEVFNGGSYVYAMVSGPLFP